MRQHGPSRSSKLVLLVGLAVSFLCGLATATISTRKNPSELHSKSVPELQDLLKTLETQLKELKESERKDTEAKVIKQIARDLIDHAYREPNQTLSQKQLSMAVELNDHPLEQIAKLEFEAKTKADALYILDKIMTETDPIKQEELLAEVEQKVYWLETGKQLENRIKRKQNALKRKEDARRKRQERAALRKANREKEEKRLQKDKQDKYKKSFKSKTNIAKTEEAKDVAILLATRAQNETDSEKKQWLLSTAYDLTHGNIELNLRKYREIEWKKRVIRDEALLLLKRVETVESESKKLELIDRLQQFMKKPLEEVQKIADVETKAKFAESKAMAIDLLKSAKTDANPASQEIKIKAARMLVKYPLSTLDKMKLKRETDHFMQTVPQGCKTIVQQAFNEHLTNLEAYDFNRIEEKVQNRILAYSKGEDWSTSTVGGTVVSLARAGAILGIESEPAASLIGPEHVGAMLADTFADFLQGTYEHLSQ